MSIQLYSSPMKYKDPNTGNYTNIIGISGNPGRGITSVELNNDYTLTIIFDDNTSVTTTSIRGNGIENIEKTSTSGLVDTYTITDSDGETYTFTVNNGMVPNLTIGTVVEGASAAATITGTSENPVLNLVLPKADTPVNDVQVNNTSIIDANGVANIQKASSNNLGVVGIEPQSGVDITSSGKLEINPASTADIKKGENTNKPIVVFKQDVATFYGLAKAAGDTTQSASSNAVGTYTNNAKASIKSMLGIVDGSTGTVEVTGTTPTITAVENTRYVCGEIVTLSFTPPASGISIVRFTSGSTATVLTLPSTVKFPEWFDSTTLETDTIYELCVTDGIYGAVMSWAL